MGICAFILDWFIDLNILYFLIAISVFAALSLTSYEFQFIFDFNRYASELWIIEHQENIIATAKLKESKKQSYSYVYNLYVAKAWRRKGLGSALVKRLIQESKQSIYLYCYVESISFYTRLGFIQADTSFGSNKLATMVYLKKKKA